MQWKLEKRNLNELKEYPKNPRQLSKKQERELVKSLKTFGQCQPLVINQDNTIIGGHQRYRVLKALGFVDADVYVPNFMLTETEVAELNIRLNRNVGDWDFDILANQWEINDLLDWGFYEEELCETEQKEEKKKDLRLVIKAQSLSDIYSLENELAPIVSKYVGASYQVKC